ncbi:MAG: cytochrome-c oxidase, cbb3-type subunit I [Labilithrix sp.]|nr:cytochrome-c oxidase, cbb3-type subunit I [Labilithrix sp.]MCW5833210.1 cytochrome-c oxidase, cbb3-type subunit I [Labilithrix sp.]
MTSTTATSETAPPLRAQRIEYDDATPMRFMAASVLWGIVGMLVGVVVALQLAWAPANVHATLGFGRLRPLHTNAVIFAFVGNMIFAGIYHSTQRLLKTRTASDLLSKIHFWGWQLIIVSAVVTLPLGLTQGKEYAELEWPIDVAITLVWVLFAINFFWTIARRNEKHLYVAIWFYIATIVTVAILHVVNSLAIPVIGGTLKSYSVYGGAQDALVQWWYGHNAVAFFLTTPVLGIMYYYLPKAAGRPVYSYRLSIIHFWALIFVYIWAGPHHLLNTALPDWAQTLGMIFSLMLWAPSWGGMLNGLLTLRGGWSKVREDPVLKFLAAGVTFYGMATFEGPLLSIKSVSGLAHYTDWIIGHVHSGALGWNGFMAAGMFYFLVPRLSGRPLYSRRLADLHFWIGTFGILLYMVAMWVSGVNQGLMWRATNPDGSLMYPTFVETLIAIRPMYWMRLIGGSMYLLGMVMMGYNLVRTGLTAKVVTTKVDVVPLAPAPEVPWRDVIFSRPIVLTVVVLGLAGAGMASNAFASPLFLIVAFVVALFGVLAIQHARRSGGAPFHRILEGRALLFTVLAGLAVLAGGVAEIVPALIVKPVEAVDAKPYRALELEGRDVFIAEGCYTCHSQMIRPMRFETVRYGDPSTLAESVYDHPFQWGSKRTGPDLAREGGKYPHLWHYRHLVDPRAITAGSNMPPYAHLEGARLDLTRTGDKMHALSKVGVPYTADEMRDAEADARAQAGAIVAELAKDGAEVEPDTQMIAVIAYLQRLGKKPEPSKGATEGVSMQEPSTKETTK